jgi:DNA-binding XRE family transcriptional regulator
MVKHKVRPHALEWGSELRKYRNLAGKTQSWLAKNLTCSNGLICGFEKGTHWPSKEMARDLDELVQASGALAELWLRLSVRRSYPAWLSELVKAEPRATLMRKYEPVGVPGLLQTEDYARTLLKAGNSFANPREINEMVDVRMRRQSVWGIPTPPRLVVILNEAVVTVPTGGAEIMSAQLTRLITMVEADTIRLHIVPGDTEHHPFMSSFTLLTFQDQPDMLYVEDAVSGRMIAEDEHVKRLDRIFGELLGVSLSPEKSLKALYEYRRTFDHGT